MTSIGQSCPLCKSQLLKFLFNDAGDFIINCSSRVCLYGVLHSKVYKANSSPKIGETSASQTVKSDEIEDDDDFFNFLESIDEEETNDEKTPASDTLTDESKLLLSASGLEDIAERISTKDDDMINQWVQEIMEAPKESTQPPAENTSQERTVRSTAKKTPAIPVVRKNTQTSLTSLDNKLKNRRPKVKGPSSRLQKTQAITNLLKANVGATVDDTRSEVSSESGFHSDGSDLNASSLTPIQRILHIEEAKKRSWGATGMPGFQPTSVSTLRRK